MKAAENATENRTEVIRAWTVGVYWDEEESDIV